MHTIMTAHQQANVHLPVLGLFDSSYPSNKKRIIQDNLLAEYYGWPNQVVKPRHCTISKTEVDQIIPRHFGKPSISWKFRNKVTEILSLSLFGDH